MQNLAGHVLLFPVHLHSNLVQNEANKYETVFSCYHSHNGGTALVFPEETLNNLDVFLRSFSTLNTHYEEPLITEIITDVILQIVYLKLFHGK
jgi:hypothetical protein